MRRHINFSCAGATLIGTIDGPAHATRGLLILSGGNEIRSGGHRGMAHLAQALATDGTAVFRFDRRGIGDSSGENSGFSSSNDDLDAAIAAFRAECPALAHITGLGLCDAAAALLIHPAADALDALILLNPWTLETAAHAESVGAAIDSDIAPSTATPNPAAIRARYIAKLKNPRELWRLVSGGVNLRKLWRGIGHARHAPAAATSNDLAAQLRAALAALTRSAHIFVATKDTTACAFIAHWKNKHWASVRANSSITLVERDTASHSFASNSFASHSFASHSSSGHNNDGTDDAAWLVDQVRAAIKN